MIEKVRQDFTALTDEKLLTLNLKCGITRVMADDREEDSKQQAGKALAAAKHSRYDIMIYQELSENEKSMQADATFREIASVGR